MIRRHTGRNSETQRMMDPVRGDKSGAIRNGFPAPRPYLPRDPEQRARLLADLGIDPDAEWLTSED
jgi:hypothetical protein